MISHFSWSGKYVPSDTEGSKSQSVALYRPMNIVPGSNKSPRSVLLHCQFPCQAFCSDGLGQRALPRVQFEHTDVHPAGYCMYSTVRTKDRTSQMV